MTMPALSLHQPWASLCVTRQPCEWCAVGQECHHGPPPMVKRFETRSWPCPPNLIGQHIAIHATTKWVDGVLGDWQVFAGDIRHTPTVSAYVTLPLGAIVGSAILEACLPIGHCGEFADNVEHICQAGTLFHHLPLSDDPWDETEHDISDQLPFGDFTPGRYAWQLDAAAPTTERCPWCWNGEIDRSIEFVCEGCPVCYDDHRCEPIQARGRQRIWNWSPA